MGAGRGGGGGGGGRGGWGGGGGGAGIAQWLERRTRPLKESRVRIPEGAAGEFSSPGSIFLC